MKKSTSDVLLGVGLGIVGVGLAAGAAKASPFAALVPLALTGAAAYKLDVVDAGTIGRGIAYGGIVTGLLCLPLIPMGGSFAGRSTPRISPLQALQLAAAKL